MDRSFPDARATLAASRPNLYVVIHKALRSCMTDALVRFGRMDPDDAAQRAAAIDCVRSMLDLASVHLDDENRFLHPALDARCGDAARRSAGEHLEHEREIEAIRTALNGLERSAPEARAALALDLYRKLALYVAKNFVHMYHEETQNMPALWAQYSDEELLAIEQAIVASQLQQPRAATGPANPPARSRRQPRGAPGAAATATRRALRFDRAAQDGPRPLHAGGEAAAAARTGGLSTGQRPARAN